jgi:hypothetical protein
MEISYGRCECSDESDTSLFERALARCAERLLTQTLRGHFAPYGGGTHVRRAVQHASRLARPSLDSELVENGLARWKPLGAPAAVAPAPNGSSQEFPSLRERAPASPTEIRLDHLEYLVGRSCVGARPHFDRGW